MARSTIPPALSTLLLVLGCADPDTNAEDSSATESSIGVCGTWETPPLSEVELSFENTGDAVVWIASVSCGSSFRIAGTSGPIDWSGPPLGAPCDRSCEGIAAGRCSIAPECAHPCESWLLGVGIGARLSTRWRGTAWTYESLPAACEGPCAELHDDCGVEHTVEPGVFTLTLDIQTGPCNAGFDVPCCDPQPGETCSVFGGSADGEPRMLVAGFEMPGAESVALSP